MLAEWIVGGEAPFDVWPVDIRRFGAPHGDIDWVRARTLELYGKHYTIAWPGEEHDSGRPLRRSPLYELLRAQGAVFGEKLGWERPNWFAARGESARATNTVSRGRTGSRPWRASTRRRASASRSSTRPRSQNSCWSGATPAQALSWICANDVAKPVGSLVYTQMLNERGGIECDLTVARLAEDRYYIVTGTGFATHDFDWIARQTPPGLDAHAHRRDLGARRAGADGAAGAAPYCEQLTRDDVGNAAFPFGQARRLQVAGAPVLALRVTYVGELGWELHIPVEFAADGLRRAHAGRR